jgi:hypothetical protein
MSYTTIAAIFLAAVFLLSAFQTLQLSSMKMEVLEQQNTLAAMGADGAAFAPANDNSANANIPSSLQNVPDMVGGC